MQARNARRRNKKAATRGEGMFGNPSIGILRTLERIVAARLPSAEH